MREGEREGGREGGRERGREGGREGEREGGRERGREGGREGERKGGSEGGWVWDKMVCMLMVVLCHIVLLPLRLDLMSCIFPSICFLMASSLFPSNHCDISSPISLHVVILLFTSSFLF